MPVTEPPFIDRDTNGTSGGTSVTRVPNPVYFHSQSTQPRLVMDCDCVGEILPESGVEPGGKQS